MKSLEYIRIRIDPVSAEDSQLIRRELAGLMNNPHFASSKRYPALLQYTVEKTLEGRSHELKERILGIEVFHRPSDYDTNNDTVVRVAASEVRKRLALTYHESGEAHEIQILMPAGSYVPEFYRQATTSVPDQAAPTDSILAVSQEPASPGMAGDTVPAMQLTTPRYSFRRGPARPGSEPVRRLSWRNFALGVALFLLGAACVLLFLRLHAISLETSVDRFWRPVRTSGTSVILCAGALVPTTAAPAGFTEAEKSDDYPYVSMATAGTLISLVDLFVRSRTDYLLEPASSATLTDMRLHPTVLLGAYNNKWTLLMLNQLRYRFNAKPVLEIVDSRNSSRIWKRPDSQPYKDEDDYAIVARFHNSLTDSTTVVIAGVGKNGTEAAAQFVTTPRYLDLVGRYQHDWASRNIEIVLKTTVVDSKTSAPSIEAVEVW